MPTAKLKLQTSQQKFYFTKRWLLWGFAGVAVLIVLTLIIRWAIDVQQEQQRFNGIHNMQSRFKTNIRQTLGAALTDLGEYDSCYRTGQAEMSFPPFPNGTLTCGMEIQGAVNAPQSATSIAAQNQALQIAAMAKSALQSSGISFTKDILFSSDSDKRSGFNGLISIDDVYHLYDQKVRCDFTIDNRFDSLLDHSVITVRSGQMYFRLNCSQASSENFFQYVPSPLD